MFVSDTSATSVTRETGKIKFFDSRKGFGFILADNGERDVFISVNNLPKGYTALDPDQRCAYIREDGKKGPHAKELTLL